MYNYLINASKNRIIDELKKIFKTHPIYNNIEIFNRFPYQERIQEGIILKNTSANRVALSSDNFQGNVFSYCSFAKHGNSPGTSIEWVREDSNHITERVVREDYSNQFTISNNKIILDNHPVNGSQSIEYTYDIRAVEVYINNQKVIPLEVNGDEQSILLADFPAINSKVEVSYWKRNLAPSGVYQIEITCGDTLKRNYEYMIDVLLDKEEILITQATGNETSVRLKDYPVFKGSLKLWENDNLMYENDDYIIDYATGIITLIGANRFLGNSTIKANYRVQGESSGPHKIPHLNYADNTSIPGVVIAFGNGVQIGDKQFVLINQHRQITSLEYGGKWELSVTLDIYAKDLAKVEDLIDITTSYFNAFRKSDFDGEGFILVDVSFSGESEEIYDEGTGDVYFMGSVSYEFLTEWSIRKPLLKTVEGINIVSDVGNTSIENSNPYEKYEDISNIK